MKIESAILRRLGPIPYWRGEGKCLAELDRIYRRATAHAAEILYGKPNDARQPNDFSSRQYPTTLFRFSRFPPTRAFPARYGG